MFAAEKHSRAGQKITGTNLPYVVHLSSVAMEIIIAEKITENFDLDLAVEVALLHDTIEDTDTEYSEISDLFGKVTADGVLALTKDRSLPGKIQMKDSLERILLQSREIWSVKLADRITNLQKPPDTWTKDKRAEYMEEAKLILNSLKDGNIYLSERLEKKISDYADFI